MLRRHVGRDLTQFARWYHQSGTPQVTVTSSFDAAAGTLTLDLVQSCPPTPGQEHKDPFVIPVAFGMLAADGAALAPVSPDLTAEEASRGLIVLTEPARKVTFLGLDAAPVPSLLRGFSAPIKLHTDLDEADLVTLAAHDGDSFNRWQAAQTLAVRLLTRSTAAIRAGAPPLFEPTYADALRRILAGAADDPAFAALALSLPGEADLAREIGRDIDPEAIHEARDAIRADLGLALADPLRTHYARLIDTGPYVPDAVSAGRRSLRNVALDLIAAGDRLHGVELARQQFETATNMTDQLAALSVLAQVAGAGARGGARGLLRQLRRGRARHRQVAGVAGCPAGCQRARAHPCLDVACRLLDQKSKPGAGAHRQLRVGQSDPLQRGRRFGLRLRGRDGRHPRQVQRASRRPPPVVVQELAGARARAPRPGTDGAGARGRHRKALPRRRRYRHAVAGLGVNNSALEYLQATAIGTAQTGFAAKKTPLAALNATFAQYDQ